MAISTPNWTDNIALAGTLATPQTLAHSNKVKGTLDLRSKFGGFLFVRLGRLGTNAPSSPILVQVRRVGTTVGQGGASFALLGGNSSGQASTVSSDSNSGQNLLVVANTVSFNQGDSLCIYDSGFTRLEFARISRTIPGSPGTLVLDDELGFTHTAAQADNVTKAADVFAPLLLLPGCVWELIVDYGAATSGSDCVVQAFAQTYDSITSA